MINSKINRLKHITNMNHTKKVPAKKKISKKKILLCSLYGRSAMLQYAAQLANALSKYEDVYVLIPDYSDTVLFDKKVKLLRIKAPPSIIKTALLSANLFTFRNLIKKIRNIDPDIIHFLDNHPWYVPLLRPFKDKTIFVTQHDISSHPGEFLTGHLTIWVNNVIDSKAERLIVHGQKLKDLLSKKFPEKKILVFPIGDFSFFLKWKKKNVKEESHTILFFGRILEYKGLDVLLKAAPTIIKKVPDLKIIIAGEGNMSSYDKFMTPEVKSHLEIINKFLPEKEIPVLFQRSSIIVMPYREASQSAVIPIAYAFKKAIICSDVGALSEVMDNNKTGILLPPENVKALSDSIIALLKDAQKRRYLGDNGYEKMVNELSWPSIAERLSKEYSDALKKN